MSATDEDASVISQRLHTFFAAQGWPRHKHSSQLAVILGLSRSGAFRKFQDGSFSATDLQALAQHFGVDLSELLNSQGARDESPVGETLAARLKIAPHLLACMATLGEAMGPNEHCELVAVADGDSWLIQPFADTSATTPRRRVLQLVVTPRQRSLPRLAILEDSPDLAANLQEAFTRSGCHATVFSSATDLAQEAAAAPFDAYVVDWWLGGGHTSAAVLQSIRRAQPAAPLVLTTGAIAAGNAAEEEIARITLALRIHVIEKPFRLALLVSQVKQLLGEDF